MIKMKIKKLTFENEQMNENKRYTFHIEKKKKNILYILVQINLLLH